MKTLDLKCGATNAEICKAIILQETSETLIDQIEVIDENFSMGMLTENEREHQIISAATNFHNGLRWGETNN